MAWWMYLLLLCQLIWSGGKFNRFSKPYKHLIECNSSVFIQPVTKNQYTRSDLMTIGNNMMNNSMFDNLDLLEE